MKEKKVNVTWTKELAQDLMAFHSINAEEELIAILTAELGIDFAITPLSISQQMTKEIK